jgi:hypothetical protein
MDTDPAAIVVQFDPGASPISGHVRSDGEPPREFTGWAGLFAALRAIAPEEPVEPPYTARC